MSSTVGEQSDSGAEFSECKKYRYRLWRVWDKSKPPVYFILMNPSTADEVKNDPTIERQCRRAKQLGFGSLVILNCGAIRETDSKIAWSDPDPIGPKNLETLKNEITRNNNALFIAGWGQAAHSHECTDTILALFRELDVPLWCLGKNNDGSPKHPLYVSYRTQPSLYQ